MIKKITILVLLAVVAFGITSCTTYGKDIYMDDTAELSAETLSMWSRPVEMGYEVIDDVEGTAEYSLLFGRFPIDEAPEVDVNIFGLNENQTEINPGVKFASYNACKTSGADGIYITSVYTESKKGLFVNTETVTVKGKALKLVDLGPVDQQRVDAVRYLGASSSLGMGSIAPDLSGGTAAAAEASDEYYDWSVSAGAQGCFDLIYGNMGVFVGGNIQWSPVPHLGMGLRVGVSPFKPYIAASTEKGGNNYEYWEEFITIAGDNTNPEDIWWYYFNGYTLFGEAQLELLYFTGSKGLSGFYAGIEGGMLMNAGEIEAYADYEHQEPIQHITSADELVTEAILPTYKWYAFRGGPLIGYKLVLSGFTIDLTGGYAVSNNEIFSGGRIGLKIGYSF